MRFLTGLLSLVDGEVECSLLEVVVCTVPAVMVCCVHGSVFLCAVAKGYGLL